jgi:hypothetical protein
MSMQSIAIAAIIALMALQAPPSGHPIDPMGPIPQEAKAAAPFTFKDGVLTVATPSLTLAIQTGEIVYLRDERTGEVFCNWYGYGGMSRDRIGAPAFLSRGDKQGLVSRTIRPRSAVDYTRPSQTTATLSYRLTDQDDAVLVIDATIDESSDDIILQARGAEKNPDLTPVSIDAPVANFRTPSVVLGSGARYTRSESAAQDQSSNEALGQNAPTMAVVEGASGVISWSSETTSYALDWLRLDHDQQRDRLLLHTQADDNQARSIETAPLRISRHASWLDAAKRWRDRFEARTAARPLWENRAEWVRRIHAVFSAVNNANGAASPKFPALAQVADPASILYFLWNGDRIVLFGDPRLIAGVPRPTADELEITARYGWPVLLYHPYLLIHSESGEQSRLDTLVRRGWLPRGYVFTPTFAGSPDQWHAYWQGIQTRYDSDLSILHPGAGRTVNYLIQNARDYQRRYGASGLYFDTLGADESSFYAIQPSAIEGKRFLSGEVSLLNALAAANPELGIMSEYQSARSVPFVFYTWEGPAIRKTRRVYAPYRLNHPLRTALIASYTWTREDNSADPDDIESALMGALPEVSLVGDYEVDPDRARWSQARARLFCNEELFNDLPERWDADVLAYYRGRNGAWFAFKRIRSTYGYVQIQPDGTQVERLVR